MSDATLPVFNIEQPIKVNFDKFNDFMIDNEKDPSEKTKIELAKRCKILFEGCIKAYGVKEREMKRLEKVEEKEPISFKVGD